MQITFGDTRYDGDLGLVTRAGETATLTPQNARLIDHLIRNRDRVVGKDDLIAHVWDGRIVTDATLSTAIKEARAILGDTGRDQRVIRTVHGRGFQFVAPIDDAGQRGGTARPVIAVLPFRGQGAGDDTAFLAEGLTQETIACLSVFSDIAVLSHRTTARFAEDALTPAAMAAEHGVDIVVEGTVRATGDRILASVHVTDAATGQLLGTERIARPAGTAALTEIEEEIARLIAGRLGSHHGLVADRIARIRREGRSQSLDTYALVAEFYGWYRSYDMDTHADLRRRLPDQLSRDPGSACGWAAYAILLLEEHRYHLNPRPGVDALGLAASAAQRAVECSPRGAFPHMTLALTRFYRHDIAGFRAAAARAIELNPGHSDVLAEIGSCHAFLGEDDRAIALLDRAMDLSPVHPGWYHYARCWRYAREGYFEAALVEIDKVPMPGFFWYHAHLAWFLAELGRDAEAREQAAIMLRLYPGFETSVRQEQELNNYSGDLSEMSAAGWRKAGLRIAGGAP